MVDSVYFLVYTISTILTILFITLGRGGIPHRQYSLQRTEYFFVPESAQFRYRRLLCIVRMRKVMKKAVYAAHFSARLAFSLSNSRKPYANKADFFQRTLPVFSAPNIGAFIMQNSQQEKNNYAQIQCPHCEKLLNVKKENALLRCPICNGGFITKIATRYKCIESEIAVAKAEKTGAGTRSTQNAAQKKLSVKQRFSAKRLALMAVFVALSYAVSWFEIPIFPATPFLKLDLGNVFILLISFLLGPIEGVVVCLLKEGLRALGSSSGGVGEIANVIMTSSYILLPSIVYHYRKGIKTVAWTLGVACLLGTGAALLSNRFINFPLYVGDGAADFFAQVVWYVAEFNLIKTAAVSVLTLLLYKRLSNFLKKWKI